MRKYKNLMNYFLSVLLNVSRKHQWKRQSWLELPATGFKLEIIGLDDDDDDRGAIEICFFEIFDRYQKYEAAHWTFKKREFLWGNPQEHLFGYQEAPIFLQQD